MTTKMIAVCAVLSALAAPAWALDAETPGYVDGSSFIEIAGEDAVVVELSLQGALLRALTRIDAELHELAGGIESIQAIVLDFDDEAIAGRSKEAITKMQSRLRGQGWTRIARMKEQGSEVQVLVLNDDETIQGLVVMVIDPDEGELVFANIAGILDLAAIEAIGEGLDVPGLDQLEGLSGND